MSNDPLPLSGDPFTYVFQPRQKFQHKWWKHIVLFLLTLGTTTFVGGLRYVQFMFEGGDRTLPSDLWFAVHGLWYSATVLAILGAHEMGHYLACRYYQIDATLPYFIPMPVALAGTLGAVIRIREPFPNRKILFDVGIAGPIAGFVVLVPALFLGMSMSHVIDAVPNASLLGRPPLYQFARWLTFGHIPATQIVNIHPMVFAAWFGMLATALNLLPFGQLDGGHITYAVTRRFSTRISLLTVASAAVMTFFSVSWVVLTGLLLAMLFATGPQHPPVLDEYEPLGAARRAWAAFALVMFILCFTPVPIQL